MDVDEDLYATLGVDPSADADSIRRAYRKLAVRWHPDKNPDDSATAEVMFKKVAAAYEVLSDARKRAAYDNGDFPERQNNEATRAGSRAGARFGARGTRGATPFGAEFGFGGGFAPHHDPFEVFREAFGGRDPFADDPFFADARGGFGLGASLFGRGDPPATRAAARGTGLGMGFGVPFFDAFEQIARGGDAFFERGPGRGQRGVHDVSRERQSGLPRGDAGYGVGRSVSSQTVVIDGRRKTRVTTTIRHADGRVETFTDEHVDDGFPTERVGGRDREAALPRGGEGGHSRLARRGYF
jgi:curved DNA-binding protein CbpA